MNRIQCNMEEFRGSLCHFVNKRIGLWITESVWKNKNDGRERRHDSRIRFNRIKKCCCHVTCCDECFDEIAIDLCAAGYCEKKRVLHLMCRELRRKKNGSTPDTPHCQLRCKWKGRWRKQNTDVDLLMSIKDSCIRVFHSHVWLVGKWNRVGERWFSHRGWVHLLECQYDYKIKMNLKEYVFHCVWWFIQSLKHTLFSLEANPSLNVTIERNHTWINQMRYEYDSVECNCVLLFLLHLQYVYVPTLQKWNENYKMAFLCSFFCCEPCVPIGRYHINEFIFRKHGKNEWWGYIRIFVIYIP